MNCLGYYTIVKGKYYSCFADEDQTQTAGNR